MRLAIIETLQQPMILTHIASKTRLNAGIVKQELGNLIAKNLVTTTASPKKPFQQSKNSNHKRPHYVLTSQGIDILKQILAIRTFLT